MAPVPTRVVVVLAVALLGVSAAGTLVRLAPDAHPLAVSFWRTASVAAEDVVYAIKAVGSLEAEEVTQVTAEVEGAVTEVLFHEGDRVGSDSVLLRIDPEVLAYVRAHGLYGVPAG